MTCARFLRLDSAASHHGFDNEIFPTPEFSRWIVTRNKKMQTGKKNEEDIFDRQFEILSSWNTIYLELRKEEISGGRRGFSSEEERSKRSVTARVTKFCRKSKIFLGYLCRLSINIETIETSGMPFPGINPCSIPEESIKSVSLVTNAVPVQNVFLHGLSQTRETPVEVCSLI